MLFYSHFTEEETEVSQLLQSGFDPPWHQALGQELFYEFLFHLDNGFKKFLNYLPMLITWEIYF